MLETIRWMVGYTRWADARMLDAASTLTPEQYTKDLGSSLKSVRDTLVHIVGAQWLYLSRFKGESPKAGWSPADYPGVAELRDRWNPVVAELEAFAAAQTEESLAKPLSYRNLKGDALSFPLGQVLLQVTNHSTYHRGQGTTLIRQLGGRPPSTDFILYAGELKT
ncbi:MAG: DinB family protein [Planctomycetaceae bacterium]|nr:DinB family protein [Planctomycetaceae bacterium]